MQTTHYSSPPPGDRRLSPAGAKKKNSSHVSVSVAELAGAQFINYR